MKKHDENKDLMLFSRVGRVDYSDKTLKASKKATIGIRMLGRIDFLTKHCGWHFMYDNSVGVFYNRATDTDNKVNARAKKKEAKAPKLTNKKKK